MWVSMALPGTAVVICLPTLEPPLPEIRRVDGLFLLAGESSDWVFMP